MTHHDKAGSVGHTMNKVTDTLGGVAGQASAAMTSSASGFAESASISVRYEIDAANIALARGRSGAVREAAQKMIDDHSEATTKLKAAVQRSDQADAGDVADKLDARRSKMIEHLNEAPDDEFDKTYIDQQIMAHEEAVKLMHHYRDKGDCPVLRSFASEMSPIIEGHLDRMKQLEDAVA